MNIEIKGPDLNNKGDYMMLLSILDQLPKLTTEKIRIVANTVFNGVNHHQLSGLGLYRKINLTRFGIPLTEFVSDTILAHYGLVKSSKIDVILDCSGFQYGEKWSSMSNLHKNLALYYQKKKKKGTKIIFLPQALGPFNTNQETYKSLFGSAYHLFARDKTSYANLISLGINEEKVSLFPDFTNLLQPGENKCFLLGKKYGCIIPNLRMVDKTNITKDTYVDFLKLTVDKFKEQNIQPIFVIHEGVGDLQIAKEVIAKTKTDVLIIHERDPLTVKAIIKDAYCVVSSRFHGLISALSQSVPSLATGWVHKYEMLMENYDCPEMLYDFGTEPEQKLEALTCENTNQNLKVKLQRESEEQKKLSMQMWSKVSSLIFQ